MADRCRSVHGWLLTENNIDTDTPQNIGYIGRAAVVYNALVQIYYTPYQVERARDQTKIHMKKKGRVFGPAATIALPPSDGSVIFCLKSALGQLWPAGAWKRFMPSTRLASVCVSYKAMLTGFIFRLFTVVFFRPLHGNTGRRNGNPK